MGVACVRIYIRLWLAEPCLLIIIRVLLKCRRGSAELIGFIVLSRRENTDQLFISCILPVFSNWRFVLFVACYEYS